jgi:two-component system CheB/CheR fusion protein
MHLIILPNIGLPDILKSASSREVRFWVAGCSTGEEAYSLAILARETMELLGLSAMSSLCHRYRP